MRKLFAILFFAVFCCSCTQREGYAVLNDTPHRAAFDAVDSIMQQPDSALVLLTAFDDSLNDTVLNPWERNRFNLLLAELLYKNDYAQENRPELLEAVAYYDSIANCYPYDQRIAFLQARSYYMDGVGCYEQDSIVAACKAYLTALETMEEHFEEKEMGEEEIRFMGLAYSRLGDLFFFDDGYVPAIETSKKALGYYTKLDDSSRMANTCRMIGNCFNVIMQNDSALYYMDKALTLKSHIDNVQDILRESAFIYYDLGEKDSAFSIARRAMNLSIDEEDYLASCYTLGDLFYQEQEYDSAMIFLKQNISKRDFRTEIASVQLLMEVYKAVGDTMQASYYAQHYSQQLEKFMDKSPDRTEIVNLYRSYQQLRIDKRYSLSFRQHKTRNAAIAVFLVAISAFIVFLSVKRNRKKRLEAENEHSSLAEQLRNANEILKEKDNAIGEKNRENDSLKRKLEQIDSAPKIPFTDEPICRFILERVSKGQFKSKVNYLEYKDFALDKQHLLVLRETIDRHFNHFTNRLAEEYPELTQSDMDYCCLYLLDLTDADISALMQRAYNTVRDRNGKLKKIFGSENAVSVTLKTFAEKNR